MVWLTGFVEQVTMQYITHRNLRLNIPGWGSRTLVNNSKDRRVSLRDSEDIILRYEIHTEFVEGILHPTRVYRNV
jgi:hypothetical protein